MAALYEMTSQMTPVASDLNTTGTDVSRTLEALAPFSRDGIPAFKSLGAHRGRRHAGARGGRADDRAAGRLHRRRGEPVEQPGEAAHEPARRERHQEPDGPDLQRDALDQRLRRARPLPAHHAAGGLQLAGDGRQPGLHRELHQGRERRERVEHREAAHRARADPRRRGSRPRSCAAYERQQTRRGAPRGRDRSRWPTSPRRRRRADRPTETEAKPQQPAAPADPDEAVLDYLLGGEE